MEWSILPAYEFKEDIRELFTEYTDMLVQGSPAFREYLKIQHYEDELADLEMKYGMPEGRLYILFCDGEAAGCIGLRKMDKERCEMKRLYIRPKFRGNGAGEQLTDRILSDARDIGYKQMYLDTLPFLDRAIRMYKKRGFYEIPRYNDSPLDETIYMRVEL